jgi:DNA-binding MarR family transcriptional regulator
MNKVMRDVMGCTCLRVRRTSRRITQFYDQALAPAGVTINQFGLLANLYGVDLAGLPGLAVGDIADRLGADPTTINRTLRPLTAKGLLADCADPADRRVRLVRITKKGKREFLDAVPFWRRAQRRVEAALGASATAALNDLLDRSTARLSKV